MPSFLDKIKKPDEPVTAESKPNPFAKAPNPFAKPESITTPVVNAATIANSKPNPFVKKTDVATATPKEVPMTIGEPALSIVPAEKLNETSEGITVSIEVPKKRTRRSSEEVAAEKAAKAAAEATASANVESQDENIDCAEYDETEASDTISTQEAIQLLQPIMGDDEWNRILDEVQTDIENIVIDADMNVATLKVALANINSTRQKLWSVQITVKSMYESLTSKEPEGLFERTRRLGGVGSNEDARKTSGIRACTNYLDQKTKKHINLYEVIDYVRYYHNFFKSAMSELENKQGLLITMNGVLKLENA